MMNSIPERDRPDVPSHQSTNVTEEEKKLINYNVKLASEQKAQKTKRQISRQQLINKLNHLNFQDLSITAIFQHNKYPRTLSLTAYPMPCSDERLSCRWRESIDIEQVMMSYRFHCLYVPSEQQLIEAFPELKSISESEAVFLLPKTCREINTRKIRRYQCEETTVFMFQNGVLFYGRLLDYGAFQFRIAVQKSESQNYRWINLDTPVTIVFTKGNETLYSGQCRIIKHDFGGHRRQFNLEPIMKQIRRFEPLTFRSFRQRLNPSLDAVFRHPLFNKTFNLKVINISGSGFAVQEEDRYAALLPGLLIPGLKLRFSDGSYVACTAQVIYANRHDEGRQGAMLRCGLVILDMPVQDHIKLLALLHQADDANAYVCNKVDMNALWDFFFETGFIYPQKYAFLKNNKEKIKATYEKLYHHSPSVGSHFIYQHNGRITAHMAMIRFYASSWLIHHHAANLNASQKGGLMVLNQICRFVNDSHRLSSMKMDYIFCYYRPENKFPNKVFGGIARSVEDTKICSTDNLAYFHFQSPKMAKDAGLNGNWQLSPATQDDMVNLETYYTNNSGGLMLRCLQLTPGQLDISELISAYHEIGLKRDRHLFALNHHGKMCALVMVNLADMGLNMSDLTNSVQFFVVNTQYLTRKIIHKTLSAVSVYLEIEEIPVLFYPSEAAEKVGLDYEKTYCLWVYDLHKYMDHIYRHLKSLIKFIKP